MKITLYVEASMCPRANVAGWGAGLAVADQLQTVRGGEVHGNLHRMPTMAELGGVLAAMEHAIGKTLIHAKDEVTIAMRSTAALAVMCWVFPDAQVRGNIDIKAPKRLGAFVKDAQCLYDLADLVERHDLKIQLQYAPLCRETEAVTGEARRWMENARLGAPV